MARQAQVTRNTNETQISVSLNLDGSGKSQLATGVGFLDHMLDQIARHGVFDLEINAKGDLHIDAHHTVEDVGITLDTGPDHVSRGGRTMGVFDSHISTPWNCGSGSRRTSSSPRYGHIASIQVMSRSRLTSSTFTP